MMVHFNRKSLMQNKINSILLFLISVVILISCNTQKANDVNSVKKDTLQIKYEYQIPNEQFIVNKDEVKKNQTLADIFTAKNISYNTISQIAKMSKNIFDVRKIQPKKNYTFYLNKDSLNTAEYFIYELNPIDYVVYHLRDSLFIHKGAKEVELRENILTGVIDNSLYLTLSEIDASPKLAILFSEVFAWQIDFYTLQKHDNFKVIFEEKYIDGEYIGVNKILAAKFNHRKKDYYAFEFDEDGKTEYFDENANSLQKAFLKAPVKFTRISSRFQRSRFHPILRIYRPHLGIDYAAPTGTPVVAVGDGVVTDKRWTKGGGRYVKIKHNGTYSSGYMHLSKYGKGISPGAKVNQGQIIGYVGSSGLATGPHLDFRFWKNGSLINYLNVEFPPSKPVVKDKKENFLFIMNNFKRKLDLTPLPEQKLAAK